MQTIGGFFGFEVFNRGKVYHNDALALTNGRSCLNMFIQKTGLKKLYMPYYTCDALLEPTILNNIQVDFYPINEDLEPVCLPKAKKGEYFLYINYFGLKNDAIKHFIKIYKKRLIIDNTHDFFSLEYKNRWSFTSVRKYFGVPDGAYLYSPYPMQDKIERFKKTSMEHLLNRMMGNQEIAYKQFVAYEKSLNAKIKKISLISEGLLSSIDYEKVKSIRKSNFEFFDNALRDYNNLKFKYSNKTIPFCYPFLPDIFINKDKFYKKQIFIPNLWLDTLNRNIKGFELEKDLSKKLLPLPIDHRYNDEDLKRIITFILSLLK